MAIKWSSKKPLEDLNGLEVMHEHFMQAAPEDVLVLGVARRAGRHLPDGDDAFPEVRFAAVEVIAEGDLLAARAMFERARALRVNDGALDMGGDV